MQLLESQPETSTVRIADLILPVFAVIISGWIAGNTGYLSRALSDALIHFAYNIAMPALLIVTITLDKFTEVDSFFHRITHDETEVEETSDGDDGRRSPKTPFSPGNRESRKEEDWHSKCLE